MLSYRTKFVVTMDGVDERYGVADDEEEGEGEREKKPQLTETEGIYYNTIQLTCTIIAHSYMYV